MQSNTLQPRTKRKSRKIVGRGGKRGTYSGRGMKGQKARTGNSTRPELRDIIKKIPKHRGYRFSSIHEKNEVVNLSEIDAVFSNGDTVSPKTLVSHRLIARQYGRSPKVKVLGQGSLTKKVTFTDCKMSKSTLEKISDSGSTFIDHSKKDSKDKKGKKGKKVAKKDDSAKPELKKEEKK